MTLSRAKRMGRLTAQRYLHPLRRLNDAYFQNGAEPGFLHMVFCEILM